MHREVSANQGGNHKQTLGDASVCINIHSENCRCYLRLSRCPRVVLATVPGYPAAVRVWNRTGWSSPGCSPENRGTHQVGGRVGTGPQFHITVPATLAPIKYLGSDRIIT